MIYIEIKFGAINGNSVTIDNALSATSTNPVQNKVIYEALQTLANNVPPKDVISVADRNALSQITEPDTSAIYITENDNHLYVWTGTDWDDVTNKKVDDTIYVTNLSKLIDMSFDKAGTYNVLLTEVVTRPIQTRSVPYSLIVTGTMRSLLTNPVFTLTLTDRTGWADVVTDAETGVKSWKWTKYSLEGHTHTGYAPVSHTHEQSDINGLQQAILDATSGKQDKQDNGLNTTAKTIVGAVNELHRKSLLLTASYSINFYANNDGAFEHNMRGIDIVLSQIATTNVSKLFVSIENGAQDRELRLVNGKWNASDSDALTIPDGAKVYWRVVKSVDEQVAEITIKFD